MSNVEFKDFSFQVKAALNEETIAWLYETGNEIASNAKNNCALDGNAGVQLRKSYRAEVDEGAGEAHIGSPLESAYWEEYGTGAHADTGKNGGKKGRSDWWVHYKNSGPNPDTPHYDESTAKSVAESLTASGKTAYATNGREPNYTLEKAFIKVRPKAEANLEARLGRRLGK